VGTPISVVEVNGTPAIASGGQAVMGVTPQEGQLPLLGHAPSLTPDRLGDARFTADYGLRAPYVVGEMANGIASEALVEAAANAGFLGVFGAAGLSVPRVTQALDRLQALSDRPWAINLIHSPDDQTLEAALVELFLARRVRVVSASAYLDLTLPLVTWRLSGIHRDASGAVVANRLIAKVSRVEVARKFLEPAPERFVAALVASGILTSDQAALAAQVPMADDVTCEADSGGHTDNRPLVLLLPAIQALRDEICQQRGYARRPRIGAAGGLATPAAVASAFAMGAAYVVTGSINQATREAGTSDLVRQMLAQASSTDVAMAPAADMFEMGVKVQVLKKGSMFSNRAHKLYDLYKSAPSLEGLPPAEKARVEKEILRTSVEQAWENTRAFFEKRDPEQIEKANKDPKHKMALVFRSYLGQASKWAIAGDDDRALDFQIWSGPAMGSFNAWVQGTFLEPVPTRTVAQIGWNLLEGAAVVTRAQQLRTFGANVPDAAFVFRPRQLSA
jgi:PfaD family protein